MTFPWDVTPTSLRQSAVNAREEADDHESFAASLEGLDRQAVDPIARTRETILRAVRAQCATDRIYKHGVTLEVSFADGSPDTGEIDATTMGGALVTLIEVVQAHHRAEAARLRAMAADMDEEANEIESEAA